MRFSHSSLSDYQTCARLYKLKRIDKLEPIKKATPLWFGSGIDDASEVIFLRYKKNLSEAEKELLKLTPIERYTQCVLQYKNSLEVKYSKADMQFELLTDEDMDEVRKLAEENELEIEDYPEFIESCQLELKKDQFGLDAELESVYNLLCWFSLYRKAEYLLDILEQWVNEHVVETHSLQKQIRLEDGDDYIIGLLDIDATVRVDGKVERRIIDLKTSSKAYKDDEANTSQQLTVYSESEGNRLVAFLVLEKSIRKREPRARIQYVPGEITEDVADEVFTSISETIEEIKNDEEFVMNEKSCYNFGRCPMFDLCKKGSMSGLRKRK